MNNTAGMSAQALTEEILWNYEQARKAAEAFYGYESEPTCETCCHSLCVPREFTHGDKKYSIGHVPICFCTINEVWLPLDCKANDCLDYADWSA